MGLWCCKVAAVLKSPFDSYCLYKCCHVTPEQRLRAVLNTLYTNISLYVTANVCTSAADKQPLHETKKQTNKPYLSGSACVMSMRGREMMGRLVGLVWVTGSSSGVRDLTRSLSFSACRHDNGGNCRLPENRLWTLHNSTPRVLPADTCPTECSRLSWG